MFASFEYSQPRHLEEAFDTLDGFGPGASLLAGGTDLVVGMRKGWIAPQMVIDVKKIADLPRGIAAEAGYVSISALTPLADVIADPLVREHFPALAQAAQTVGSVQIRNRATLTGNLCNASPAADTAPALLAFGARVVLVSRHGSRRVALDEFLLGPRSTSLWVGEIAVAIEIPVPQARTGSQFARLTRRQGVDLATISLCCTVGSRVTRFAFGAVAPKPFVRTDESGVLANPEAGTDARRGVLRGFVASAAPISDLRGSREYRRAMLLTLSERALRTAISRRDQTGAA